ncbi:unnamed protein product [Gongylonema pulchrum]|uniref:Clathrin_bdg domain-containing protein n=1 Tax=Gongylonema pulchrum TaxID=637853 RepID=A0A183CWZ7_9BILA|nr:unnamed protein product [Gongylonema pulchrum]
MTVSGIKPRFMPPVAYTLLVYFFQFSTQIYHERDPADQSTAGTSSLDPTRMTSDSVQLNASTKGLALESDVESIENDETDSSDKDGEAGSSNYSQLSGGWLSVMLTEGKELASGSGSNLHRRSGRRKGAQKIDSVDPPAETDEINFCQWLEEFTGKRLTEGSQASDSSPAINSKETNIGLYSSPCLRPSAVATNQADEFGNIFTPYQSKRFAGGRRITGEHETLTPVSLFNSGEIDYSRAPNLYRQIGTENFKQVEATVSSENPEKSNLLFQLEQFVGQNEVTNSVLPDNSGRRDSSINPSNPSLRRTTCTGHNIKEPKFMDSPNELEKNSLFRQLEEFNEKWLTGQGQITNPFLPINTGGTDSRLNPSPSWTPGIGHGFKEMKFVDPLAKPEKNYASHQLQQFRGDWQIEQDGTCNLSLSSSNEESDCAPDLSLCRISDAQQVTEEFGCTEFSATAFEEEWIFRHCAQLFQELPTKEIETIILALSSNAESDFHRNFSSDRRTQEGQNANEIVLTDLTSPSDEVCGVTPTAQNPPASFDDCARYTVSGDSTPEKVEASNSGSLQPKELQPTTVMKQQYVESNQESKFPQHIAPSQIYGTELELTDSTKLSKNALATENFPLVFFTDEKSGTTVYSQQGSCDDELGFHAFFSQTSAGDETDSVLFSRKIPTDTEGELDSLSAQIFIDTELEQNPLLLQASCGEVEPGENSNLSVLSRNILEVTTRKENTVATGFIVDVK